MRESLWLTIIGLIADATWITLLLSILGWTFAQQGAVLPFGAVLLVLITAYVCGRTAPVVEDQAALFNLTSNRWLALQTSVGLVVAIAVQQFVPAAVLLPRLWLASLAAGEISTVQGVGFVLGLFAAAAIWRRGVTLGMVGVRERFGGMFFCGSLTAVSAALLESICACGAVDGQLVLMFFASTLIGLALSQLPADDGNASAWRRAVTYAVGAILLVAVIVGHLSNWYGVTLAGTLGELWRAILSVVVDAVVVVIGPMISWIFELLTWIFGVVAGSGAEVNFPDYERLRAARTTAVGDTWARSVVQLTAVTLLLFALYKVLMRRKRSRFLRPAALSFDLRERIEAGDSAGWLDLLIELVPTWLRRRITKHESRRVPLAEPGISASFALYFSMLETAERRGAALDPAATPNEQVVGLEIALSGAPVSEITECFNRACYGGIPSDSTTLAALRAQLDTIAST